MQGQVQFRGEEGWVDLLQLEPRRLRGIRGREVAVIFQEPMTALNPLFSVGEQIAEVVELHEGRPRPQAWARAVELLQRTGVPEPERRAHAYPHQLSGGQRQRAMIAMALACRPRLLLADEPTTALDVTLRQQILDLLAEIQRTEGMAVLLITHDLPHGAPLCRPRDRHAAGAGGGAGRRGAGVRAARAPLHAHPARQPAGARCAGAGPPLRENCLVEAQGLRVAYPVSASRLARLVRCGALRGRPRRGLHACPRAVPWG